MCARSMQLQYLDLLRLGGVVTKRHITVEQMKDVDLHGQRKHNFLFVR
jgi:hypothetical protein